MMQSNEIRADTTGYSENLNLQGVQQKLRVNRDGLNRCEYDKDIELRINDIDEESLGVCHEGASAF